MLYRPRWEDAPTWAKYLAMDSTGYWYWYEEKPTWLDANQRWGVCDFGLSRVRWAQNSPINAQGSLEERPTDAQDMAEEIRGVASGTPTWPEWD